MEGDDRASKDQGMSLRSCAEYKWKFLHNHQVKSIGVSNFTIEHLDAIIEATGVVPVSRSD